MYRDLFDCQISCISSCRLGVFCAALLPGPDASEGAFSESHGTGTPPAPLPQDVRTSFLHCSPHETLPPSLTYCPKPALFFFTLKTHILYTHCQGGSAPNQLKHSTAWWHATNTHTWSKLARGISKKKKTPDREKKIKHCLLFLNYILV